MSLTGFQRVRRLEEARRQADKGGVGATTPPASQSSPAAGSVKTSAQLKQMNKDAILAYALGRGLELDESLSKDRMIAAIQQYEEESLRKEPTESPEQAGQDE